MRNPLHFRMLPLRLVTAIFAVLISTGRADARTSTAQTIPREVTSVLKGAGIVVSGVDEAFLEGKLSQLSTIKGVSWSDAFLMLVAAENVADKLTRGDYEGLAKLVAGAALAKAVNPTALGSATLGTNAIAQLAALPIELSLSKFNESVQNEAVRWQIHLYVAARELNASHQQILRGAAFGLDIEFIESGGPWLLAVGNTTRSAFYAPNYPPPGSQSRVYDTGERVYEAKIAASSLKNEKAHLLDNFKREIAGGKTGPLAENKTTSVPVSASPTLPTMPYIESDPWDVESNKGVWKLNKASRLLQAVNSSQSAASISAGTCVVAESMELHSSGYQLWEIQKPRRIEFWNWVEGRGTVKAKRSVKKGDRVAVLRYFGEGECVVWFEGQTHIGYCPATMDPEAGNDKITGEVPTPAIWARITTRNGTSGWLRNPDAEGMSRHDSEPDCFDEKWITSGAWKGTVKQGARTYPVSLTIDDLSIGRIGGKIDYPTLQCGGTLRIRSREGRSRVITDEQLEFGQGRCQSKGAIQLDFRGSSVEWQWMYPDGRVGAHAVLTRP